MVLFKNKYRYGSPAILAPWIFVVLVAVLAGYVVHHIDKDRESNTTASSPDYLTVAGLTACLGKLPTDAAVTTKQVEACVDSAKTSAQGFDEAVKPRVDELKWLLTIIGTLAGFFAIAQGAAAWFSAQVYTKQAEQGLAAISSIQDEIKARYPLFEEVARQRKQALADLNSFFASASKAAAGMTEALDWKDNLFRTLGVEKRQRLLSVESFASIDLDPDYAPEEHAEILRKLALFYRSKFVFEDAVHRGLFADMERAELYLIMACQRKPEFTINNDLGSIYGTFYNSLKRRSPANDSEVNRYMQLAEQAFTTSIRMEPRQQRAYHNLAIIAGRDRRQFSEAIEHQARALERKVWQHEPSAYMTTIMCYNMACYHSRLLVAAPGSPTSVDVRMASKVIEYLERATTVSYVRKEIIKTDFEDPDKGDLVGLIKLADETLREKLQRLRKRLEQAADTGEREPKRQSFLEALKGARNTFAELRRNPGAPN